MGKASRKKQERQEVGLSTTELRALYAKYGVVLNRADFPAGPMGDFLAEHYAKSLITTLSTLDDGLTRESVFRSVRGFYELLDGEMKKQPNVVAFGGRRMEIACKSGCDHCCGLRITLVAPMAAYLGTYIREKKDPAYVSALQERIAAYRAKTDVMMGKDRLLAMVQCPLLVDGICSVYYARPSVCRGHHSLDVSKCIQMRDDPGIGHVVPIDERRKAIEMATGFGFDHAYRYAGLPMDELELIPALDVALRRENALEEWLAGGNPFAEAHRADLAQAHMELAGGQQPQPAPRQPDKINIGLTT